MRRFLSAIALSVPGVVPVFMPAAVGAQPLALQAEAGAAAFVLGPQRDRFGPGGGAAVRLELPVARFLAFQVGGGTAHFSNGPPPSDAPGVADPGAGSAFHGGGGLRLRPIPGLDRLWLDSDASYVRTGGLGRFGIDGGLGYDLVASGAFSGAPFVRYTHVFQPNEGLDHSDAQIAMVGVAVSWRRPGPVRYAVELEPEPEPTDGDVSFEIGSIDACPGEPEVRNGVDDEDGCPDTASVEVVEDQIVLQDRIYFETDEANILPESMPVLKAVADFLTARPDITRVRIEGHGDDRGGRRYNVSLSARRAQQVARELVGHGVAPERLEAVGYGRMQIWQEGHSEDARQANRRVEFRIIGGAGALPGSVLPSVSEPAPSGGVGNAAPEAAP